MCMSFATRRSGLAPRPPFRPFYSALYEECFSSLECYHLTTLPPLLPTAAIVLGRLRSMIGQPHAANDWPRVLWDMIHGCRLAGEGL